MLQTKAAPSEDLNPQETVEWLESLDDVIDEGGPERAAYLLQALNDRAAQFGVTAPLRLNTPFVNTIPSDEEAPYPGDRELERKIKSLIRWNALAMVVRANKYDDNIGGHISTYASVATLIEVGQNHFFHGSYGDQPGDFVYYQGHSSPGMYARAFVEGRLTAEHLKNFRHELRDFPGLSSYPHPWLMPEFWQFPTVSMGLGPINALYQARFMRYLESRGIIPKTPRKVWGFLGDGECDEPETLGAISLGAREKLDNLIFVINCNLQRLDGPVRGNSRVVDELEGTFRGAGWNVIKVLWGSDWDELFARDHTGLLIRRIEECVDGEFQNFKAKGGAFVRKEFFGRYPELAELVKDMSDEDLARLRRGGHDPIKVYNAYKRAVETKGVPTVILAMTVKGYGLGEAGEGRNATHQQKKLSDTQVSYFWRRFDMAIPEESVKKLEFYRPPDDSPEMQYLKQRLDAMGGPLPQRKPMHIELQAPDLSLFHDTLAGSGSRAASTTSGFVAVLKALLRSDLKQYIVPIVPDEARTFGMDSLFTQIGIYSSQGQKYTPVDRDMVMYYKEATDGQMLEEGITEAGAMASFTAAGTAYANYRVPMIPFFVYYSMFGYQRVGDLVWAFGDSRGKGFLVGGTAGRTTLLGEGLQHTDGHSPLLFSVVPTCKVYDPAYAYEIAVIVRDGIRRMYQNNEDCFYYITAYNENYPQPAMPQQEGLEEGILRGLYRYRAADNGKAVVHLFGSGTILNEAIRAQQILSERYGVAADVWSVTSYVQLRRDALACERWNRLHPDEPEHVPYLKQALAGVDGPIIAATDYLKALPDQLTPWLPGRITSLGTDGFGRSENRQHLRRHFENDAESIAASALVALARDGKFDRAKAAQAIRDLGLDPDKRDPATA